MKKVYLLLFLLFFTFSTYGQLRTLQTSGDWDVASNWSTSNIPDQITEDVAFNNQRTATIRNNSTYSVGNVDLTNGNTLTIQSGSRLTVGSTSSNKIFSTNNDAVLYVYGNLYIYGDLDVKNKLTLVVTGIMYVSGNVKLEQGSSLDVSGSLTVGGNFTGGNNTSLKVDGSVSVGGSISVGQNSTLTGTGTVTSGGTCSGPNGFCQNVSQPVNLLYFKATAQSNAVEINWASSKTWDFSHYELERSANGAAFDQIATIDAEEFSNETIEYSYSDPQPLSGISYYRLKAVDIDGSFEYKAVELVKFGAETFKVYPNPSNQKNITVSWSYASEGTSASLRDSAGRTVRTAILSSSEDKISTEGLPAGLYLLSVKSPAGARQAQVIIQ